MSARTSPFALALLITLVPAPAFAQSEADWPRIAGALVERMALQPGERVLLVGAAGRFEPLIPVLRAAITGAGAIDLGALDGSAQPLGAPTPFVTASAGMAREALAVRFRDVDLAVMLPGPTPAAPAYAAMQDALGSGRGRTIHFHWEGAYALDGTVLTPTAAIDAVYRGALLETDYAALETTQRAFESALRAAEVRVTTPLGTDIRFRIGERPVTKQDGDASRTRADRARNLIDREIELPAGAIRVAPLEESVHGTIALPPSLWSGQPVRGLVLRIEAGEVVEVRASEGRDAVEAEMAAAGPASRRFREFALGFNPLLAIPEAEPWIPYYGYGAGVVRLSLGDNSELGGRVTGGYVRWNFFTDATIRVGDTVWVRDGRLLRTR
ncbi:MAG: aminopeptidase [Gemmatimonadetes bacterium]|nr:aminopeptidase [Gemmatimonadota bacterium]